MGDTIIIRVKSHHDRQCMEQELGRKPQGYFSWDFKGEFREVTEKEWAQLQGIKGLGRAGTTGNDCVSIGSRQGAGQWPQSTTLAASTGN